MADHYPQKVNVIGTGARVKSPIQTAQGWSGLQGVRCAPARWVGSKEGVRESFLPRLHEVVWMKSSPRIGHGGIGGSWNAPLIGGQSSG
jgi:hypothetical protein